MASSSSCLLPMLRALV